MPVKAEDFHLIITKNKKHETILRFKSIFKFIIVCHVNYSVCVDKLFIFFIIEHDKEHLKEHEYVYKKILHKKPDSLQLVVDDDQDLIVHFEDNEGKFSRLLSK